jgi:hypothetical protein
MIRFAWSLLACADIWAEARDLEHPQSDAWTYCAAKAFWYEREGLRLLAKACGV